MSKRKIITFVLVGILVLSGIFLVSRNIFKADVLGAYTISGKIYGQDSKAPLADVSIALFSTSSNDTNPATAKTDALGFFSLSAPDSTYTNISIIKDNYWDMEGVFVNAGGSTSITANLTMKPGFGKEDIEIVAVKRNLINQNNYFGLSLNPTDDSPASLKQIVPDGNSYKEKYTSGIFRGFDHDNQFFYPYVAIPGKVTPAGDLPADIAFSSATYSPDTDKYYLFGAGRVYAYDRLTQTFTGDSMPDASRSNYATRQIPAKYASIYLPEKKSILVFSTSGSVWFYQPEARKFAVLNSVSSSDYLQVFRANDKIYLLLESGGATKILTLPANEFSQPCGANCTTITQDSPAISRVGATPFYFENKTASTSQNILYLLGGLENGQVKDDVLSLDTNDIAHSSVNVHQDIKLPTPIAYPAYQTIGRRIYLFGGITDTNYTPNTKTISVKCDSITNNLPQGEILGGTPTFDQEIYQAPFASDNSSRTLIFTPKILAVSSFLTLKAGQAYSMTPIKDAVMLFRGKASQEPLNFTIKAVDADTSPSWFANPLMTTYPLTNITIKDGDASYSLKEAAEKGLIDSTLTVSDDSNFSKEKKLDLTQDISGEQVMPGQYLVVKGKKSGVGVILSSVNPGPYAFGKLNFISEPSSISFLSDVEIYIDPLSYLIFNNGEKLPNEYRAILASINSVGHFTIGPLPKGKKIGLIASYNNFQSGTIINVPDNNTEVTLSKSLSVKPPEPNPNNWNSATLHLTAKDKTGQNIDGEVAILVPLDTDTGSREVNVTNGVIEFSNLPFGTYTVLITKGGQDSIVTYELGTTGTINFQPTTYIPPVITDSYIVEEEI